MAMGCGGTGGGSCGGAGATVGATTAATIGAGEGDAGARGALAVSCLFAQVTHSPAGLSFSNCCRIVSKACADPQPNGLPLGLCHQEAGLQHVSLTSRESEQPHFVGDLIQLALNKPNVCSNR